MSRYPKCDKLRADAKCDDWAEMLAFYCRQDASQDIEIAREVNNVCVRLACTVTERGRFIEELKAVKNVYVRKFVEYFGEVQVKDDEKVTQMVNLTNDLDLISREKDVFNMKLKGVIDF